ncbi:MAG: hypothetical protein ACREPM_04470, partial [Gemmatimonadaceae bacterium]
MTHFHDELDLLDQLQADAQQEADVLEAIHGEGFNRREFVFLSLVTAAASTFGFGARALAQAPGGFRQGGPQQPPPPPLGNGEPVSWT